MPTKNFNIVDAPGPGPSVDAYFEGGAPGGDGSIEDGSVSTAKLADSAVTGQKIANSAVTAAKLAADAVTNDKIADGTIQAAKLASGVIPTLPGNASTATPGLVKQAAHVDPTSGTVQDVVNALISAGIMAGA